MKSQPWVHICLISCVMKWTVHIKHSAHGEVWLLTQGMQRVIGSVAGTSHNFLWTSFTIKWKEQMTDKLWLFWLEYLPDILSKIYNLENRMVVLIYEWIKLAYFFKDNQQYLLPMKNKLSFLANIRI